MSNSYVEIAKHYATTGLLARPESALRGDGLDPAHPTIEASIVLCRLTTGCSGRSAARAAAELER